MHGCYMRELRRKEGRKKERKKELRFSDLRIQISKNNKDQ